MTCNYFLPSVGCLFPFLHNALDAWKFLILITCNLSTFLLLLMLLVYQRIHCQIQVLSNRKTKDLLLTVHMQISKAEMLWKGKKFLFKSYINSKHSKKSNHPLPNQTRTVSGCTWSSFFLLTVRYSFGGWDPGFSCSRIPQAVLHRSRGAGSGCQPSSTSRLSMVHPWLHFSLYLLCSPTGPRLWVLGSQVAPS